MRGIYFNQTEMPDIYTEFLRWGSGVAMPAFFFISGMFVAGAAFKPFRAHLINLLQTGVYVYFVWVVLHGTVHLLFSGYTNRQASFSPILNMLVTPPWHFWYIYALVLLSLFYVSLRKVGLHPAVLAILGILFYRLSAFPHQFSWDGSSLVMQYFLFYAVGAWISKDGILVKISHLKINRLLLLLGVATCISILMILMGLNEQYLSRPFSIFPRALVLLIVLIILERYGIFRFLGYIGKRSLEIYVAHVIATAGIRIILMRFFDINDPLPHILLGTFAGVVIPLGIAVFTEKLGFPYLYRMKPKPGVRRLHNKEDSQT